MLVVARNNGKEAQSTHLRKRLIISTRWRFLFYAFSSRSDELHWVEVSKKMDIFFY
jgi:hypothetical protein